MGFRNVRNPIGVYPHNALPAAREVLDRLGTPFVYLKSVAEAALHNPNMIVHTVGAVMSIPRIEATHGDFCMYHEAFTPSTWNLLEALDGEKMRVLEHLGCDPVPYVEACKFRNSLDDERDAKEVFFAYAAMPERAKGPLTVRSRYIMEDVLEKYLRYIGYPVKRVMNITDVGHLASDADTGEDKMLKGARREHKTVMEIAQFYTDAFFEDPKALTGAYVIPIRITGSPDTENILYGKPVDGKEDSADIHVSEDWSEKPMHFALFGVKYVNPWHGSWLRRGALIVRDRSGAVIEEECVAYREEFVEQDEVVKLTTTSLTSLETELSVGAERWTLALSVDEQTRRMTVASTPASAIEVSGTGSYKENGDSWGGTPENPTPRDAVYLNYFYERENGQRCEVLDTLVFRDRGIVFEADRPTIK